MKILALEKELISNGWENRQELLFNEAKAVFDLYKAGILREIYFNERHEAVLILECADRNAAQQALCTLPLVNESLISFDLIELHPYTGYSRLFK